MRFSPHEYQRYCIQRIVDDPAVGLFLEMGLGKTVITLTAIDELRYNRWAVSRVLVIAPKKVAEATWNVEAAKWDHLRRLRVIPVMGTARQRIRALYEPGDVWVIGRDNVPWLVDYYRHGWPFDMVVLDESTSFKNPQSKRFRALKLVRGRIGRIVLLTGTPAPNGYEDLWAQMYLLDGGARLGRTLTSFRDAFCREDYAYPGQAYRTYSLREGAAEAIRTAISDICVSLKAEDYLSLPDRVEEYIPVELDPAAWRAYKKLEREMLLEVDETTITASSAAVLNGKLLQLCSGMVYDGQHNVVHIHDCKLEAFAELLEQLHGQPALVFYWFQHERDRLLALLQKTGLRARAYAGPEDTEAWNTAQLDVLLAHPASCAHGLNLQDGGHHIVWYGYPNWNLEMYQQANARLHRQGQVYPVIIHHLVVRGGMDEDVVAALRAKGNNQEALMQALKARIERARKEAGDETHTRYVAAAG